MTNKCMALDAVYEQLIRELLIVREVEYYDSFLFRS